MKFVERVRWRWWRGREGEVKFVERVRWRRGERGGGEEKFAERGREGGGEGVGLLNHWVYTEEIHFLYSCTATGVDNPDIPVK